MIVPLMIAATNMEVRNMVIIAYSPRFPGRLWWERSWGGDFGIRVDVIHGIEHNLPLICGRGRL